MLVHSINAVLFYVASVLWVMWHVPIYRHMHTMTRLIRAGILIVFFNTANLSLFHAFKLPFFVGYTVRLVAGMMITTGLAYFLWKYRHDRETAELRVQADVRRAWEREQMRKGH